MIHHEQDHGQASPGAGQLGAQLSTARSEKAIAKLIQSGNGSPGERDLSPRVVCVLGKSGSGKTSLAVRIAKADFKDGPVKNWCQSFDKVFVGPLHFTNEFLSTLEAAATFLGEGSDASLIERLLCGFKDSSKRRLLLISGFDRLLAPNGLWRSPSSGKLWSVGRPASHEVARFLNAITSAKFLGMGRIMLFCTILPDAFLPKDHRLPKNHRRNILEISGVGTGDTVSEGLADLDKDGQLPILVEALRGHAYVLHVLDAVLKKRKGDERQWIDRLNARLTAIELPRRATAAISAVIARLRSIGELTADDLELLERIASFTTPVEVRTLKKSQITTKSSGDVDVQLKKLDNYHLVLRVNPTPVAKEREKSGPARYTAHTLVRSHVLQLIGTGPGVQTEPQRLDIVDFASEPGDSWPETDRGYRRIGQSLDALLASAEKLVEKNEGSDRTEVRELARGAFGLIRSHWSAMALGRQHDRSAKRVATERLPLYEEYQRRLYRLLNLVRGAQGSRWFGANIKNEEETSTGAILYADELLWLYNELALVGFNSGQLHDAYALARMTQDVAHHIEKDQRFHTRLAQAELALAQIELERGKIPRAEHHVSAALHRAGCRRHSASEAGLGDKSWPQELNDLVGRAQGYRGLIHHLAGRYAAADVSYGEAIEILQGENNHRGLSIFHRHRSDLRRRMNDVGKPYRPDVELSLAAAESGRHPDLMHWARVAAAMGASGEQVQSLEGVRAAVDFAREVGIPKLEAEACRVRGAIALRQGELDQARRLAVRALRLATFYGMGLRQTASLVFMGRVERAAGDNGAAARILHSAIRLAERQGYQVQLEEAERELLQVGGS